MKILIVYATKHGSTSEVAVRVAEVLRDRGHVVVTQPAGGVADLGAHDAVVLGAALYMGRLHQDARRFLRRHEAALAALPFAVFAMGPMTLEPKDLADARSQLDRALAHVPSVDPRAVAVFGGVVDPDELHFPLNRMPAADARDWNAIAAWAGEVAGALDGAVDAHAGR